MARLTMRINALPVCCVLHDTVCVCRNSFLMDAGGDLHYISCLFIPIVLGQGIE